MAIEVNIDASAYVKNTELPSNLTLYPTTVNSSISGYKKLVSSMNDPDYDDTAVDVSTPPITGVDILVAELASEAGVLVGSPGIVNLSTIGNVKRLSGSSKAVFYYKLFRRNSAGVETLLATSSNSTEVDVNIYEQFYASAVLNDGVWIATDRIVVKFYGSKVGGGSDSVFQLQFGGSNPVRTIVPVPAGVVVKSTITKDQSDTSGFADGTLIGSQGNKTVEVIPTKSLVGLGNVDNISDANKPISTATQTALNAKQATLVSGTNIKTINGASIIGSGDLAVASTGVPVTTDLSGGNVNVAQAGAVSDEVYKLGKSTNLIHKGRPIVGQIPKYDGTSGYYNEGKSIVINLDSTKKYFIIRDNMVKSGANWTSDQYRAMGCYFMTGLDGTGSRVQGLSGTWETYASTLMPVLAGIPPTAQSMILTVKTATIDLEGHISVQENSTNFCLPLETKYKPFLDQSLVLANPNILYDQTNYGAGSSGYTKICRTDFISVKPDSIAHIKVGITTGLFGAVVSMYDVNANFIGYVGAVLGNFTVTTNCITPPVKDSGFAYISLSTVGVGFITVSSASGTSSYILPEVKIVDTPQLLKPIANKVLLVNMPSTAAPGTRPHLDIYTKSARGRNIQFRVSPFNLAYGIGSKTYTYNKQEDVTNGLIGSKIIEDNTISAYYSFRVKIGGVQDNGFIGHGSTVVTSTFKFYNETGEVLPSASNNYIVSGDYIKVVQEGILNANMPSGTPQVATFSLSWIIKPNGIFEYINKVPLTAAVEITNQYIAMGMARDSSAVGRISIDKFSFHNDAMLRNVTQTGTRQYIESTTERRCLGIDYANDFEIECEYQAYESTHPSTTNDKLSFQSETNFAKLYYYFGLGNRSIGDFFYVSAKIKYS